MSFASMKQPRPHGGDGFTSINVTNLLGMPENPELALNIPFCLEHRKHPFCSVEPQKNVSQVRTYLHS